MPFYTRILPLFIAALTALFLVSCALNQGGTSLTLATTTSLNDSGLLDYLKPEFEKDTGITLKIIAQGTGQAIKTGENGDADILFVHSKSAEEKFVSDGYGLKRIEIMYNYFVIVGPKNDPAGIAALKEKNAANALKQIMNSKASFVSRGDDSGTNKKELQLFKDAGIEPSGSEYISAGKGMGAVLSMASEKGAYTLSDKATYVSMKKKLDLEILLESADDLKNQYTVIPVNPKKNKGINKAGDDRFVKWITSDKALKMIDRYGLDEYGERLFTVNYDKK
ncbi:MAG: tungsten ABC transporter substrate-binding protein [Ruminiclostridium sp.]|nr:tungsten ABC transporter substrate-binding protein [Ruminiclostridium sp.]